MEDWAHIKISTTNRVILVKSISAYGQGSCILASLFHDQEFDTMLAQEKFSFIFLNCKYSTELAVFDVVTVVNLVLSNAKINTPKNECVVLEMLLPLLPRRIFWVWKLLERKQSFITDKSKQRK